MQHFRRNVELLLQPGQTVAAFFRSLFGIAPNIKPGLGTLPALPQRLMDIAAEQRRNIHLDRRALHIGFANGRTVDRRLAMLGEDDRKFRANAGTGGAVGLAVARVADLDSAGRSHGIHAK